MNKCPWMSSCLIICRTGKFFPLHIQMMAVWCHRQQWHIIHISVNSSYSAIMYLIRDKEAQCWKHHKTCPVYHCASYLKCLCCRMFSSVIGQFISGSIFYMWHPQKHTHQLMYIRTITHTNPLKYPHLIVHKVTHSHCTLTEWPVCIYEVLPLSCV